MTGEQMAFDSLLTDISFRLIGTDAAPAEDNRFHLQRPDGSVVTLLDGGDFCLEWGNADLGPGRSETKARLRRLAEMPKMSTIAIGAVVNSAVAHMAPGTAFVNVGVWHGYSFLAGLLDNPDKRAFGIDNFSQFGGPRDEFLARFESLRSPEHSFADSDYRDFFEDGFSEPIGVYIYDGEHSYENQLEGLRVAEPFFADDCLIIVDDTNWRAPRKATFDFLAHSPKTYSVLLDVRTAGQHPTLWNGLLVLRAGAPPAEGPPLEEIRAPALEHRETGTRQSGELVSVLVGLDADPVAAAGTLSALEAQTHQDIELLPFGAQGEPASDGSHHASAAEALAASSGDYAAIVDAGVRPPSTAVAEAVTAARREDGQKPYEWRNQRGLLRR
jgi:Methyltransferase domain